MELEADPSNISALIRNGSKTLASAVTSQDLVPYSAQDIIFTLRSHFYLWTPQETLFRTLADVPNIFPKVIYYMPMLVLMEIVGLLARGKPLPRWNHSILSVCCVILLFLPSVVLGNIEFNWFRMLYEKYRIIDLPWDSSFVWILCFFACDLGTYLWHRAAHEINFLWAFHSIHHSSDEMNIFAGYRLPTFNRQVAIMFYLPMAFIFPPSMFYFHYQLNYVSQLWVHTYIVEGPVWLGYFTISPRLHRVHHARNRYCIDKNYGAILSIWDHMFGTFAAYREDVPLSFGLVSRIQTFDSVGLQFGYMKSIIKRAASYDNWKDRVFCFIKGPGWEPGKPRLGIYEEIPETYDDKPYDKKTVTWVYVYLTWTLLLAIMLYGAIPQAKATLDTWGWFSIVIYLLWTVANAGYILEHKPWVPSLEVLRAASFFLLEAIVSPVFHVYRSLWILMRYTSMLSVLIWSFKLNMFCSKEAVKLD